MILFVGNEQMQSQVLMKTNPEKIRGFSVKIFTKDRRNYFPRPSILDIFLKYELVQVNFLKYILKRFKIHFLLLLSGNLETGTTKQSVVILSNQNQCCDLLWPL